MMSIDNKEEVGAQGQRLNEPNIGVPIKKRPFQLTNPGNPSSSNMYKPAVVQTHPLHDINAIDMEGNYCPLKPNNNSSLGMEMLQFGNVPELHLSISGNMVKKENNNECLTDLSLTTSNACLKPSHNLSNQKEKRSVFDLNLPTNETWDSALDGFTSENYGIAYTEPVKVLGKQGSVGGMIPHGVDGQVLPNVVVAGLVPTGSANNLKLPNTMSKSLEMHNRTEVTLDLQLKLPPRPQLRMKDLEPFCSSDLSLSSSGKDFSSCPEPVNVKTTIVENSQKCDSKDINNYTLETATQNQIMVKQESREVSLSENVLQKSGLQDQSLASGSVVKKEPIDTTSNAQHPLGKLLDKSPCSGSESRLDKRTEISETNSLTKGIDLNSAALLPEASTGGKTENPVLTETVLAGQVFQNSISQSNVCLDPENVDNRKHNLNTPCLAVTSSSLVCSEDIKPVILTCTSPGSVVDNSKRITYNGLSQGSADMDCSKEGHNLSKSVTICKTVEKANCENNGSSSSNLANISKQEPCLVREFENVEIRTTLSGENVISSIIPNSKEDQIQTSMPVEANSVQSNESDTPSSCTKIVDVPDKNMQGVFLDMEAGCSKSRSPSSSRSMRDKDFELSSERENVTSHRQTEGSDILHRRVKRADLDADRAQFERKRPRWSSWNERSNLHSSRVQRWEGPRFSQFDGDRFENEDSSVHRSGINMANRKRQTNNRFHSRFGHSKYSGFRFTRTNSNSDINFDEGNDRRNNRPHPRFQNRRHIVDISPRGSDELDAPDFEHGNHYKRVDHTMHRERSSSPGTRRGLHQWTPPSEMIAGHPDLLTRVDTRIRSPGRRPFFKKDNLSRRHVSSQYNRGRKPGRGMHWNNGRQQRYDVVNPHGSVADVQDLDAYEELRCHGGEIMPIHRRYPDSDGAYSDGGGPHGRVRNYDIAITRRREMADQDDYRYNNRGSHGWRDGNPNNGSDKSKRRRF